MHGISDPTRHQLAPHPASHPGSVREIAVQVGFPDETRLTLRYQLWGDLQSLQLPEPRPALRTDGLWRHTCFEAFIATTAGGPYWEYNFSPSGAWAAYRFAAYREGMAPLMQGLPPHFHREEAADSLSMEVVLDLSWMNTSGALRLGLAAVIEDRARGLSWWALTHPAGKPDFHHADSFAIELVVPPTSKLDA